MSKIRGVIHVLVVVPNIANCTSGIEKRHSITVPQMIRCIAGLVNKFSLVVGVLAAISDRRYFFSATRSLAEREARLAFISSSLGIIGLRVMILRLVS